jgi:D-alanyl-D-alanine carboxypeptidase
MTKPITTAAAMILVDEGKIGLDDPVSKYLPEVPNGDNITIRMLLEMRSGLYNFTTDPALLARINAEPDKALQRSDFLAVSFAHPPNFPPGQAFEYSNTNYVVAGLIIEKVTGRSYADELQARIFDPLNLRDTVYPAPADTSIPSPHPQGYDYDISASPAQIEAAQRGEVMPEDVTGVNFPGGADGKAISTANDLARYTEALVDGRLLSPQMQRERIASIKPVDFVYDGYGLALTKDGPWLGHGGVITGFETYIGRDPEERNTVVVWTSTQLRLAPQGGLVLPAFEIADEVTTALYGQSPPDRPPKSGRTSHPYAPAAPLPLTGEPA